jgi:ActR/RegA family two-component response regulator
MEVHYQGFPMKVTKLQSAFNEIERRLNGAIAIKENPTSPFSEKAAWENIQIGLMMAQNAISAASGLTIAQHRTAYDLLLAAHKPKVI